MHSARLVSFPAMASFRELGVDRVLLVGFVALLMIALVVSPLYLLAKTSSGAKMTLTPSPAPPSSSTTQSVVTEHGAVSSFSTICSSVGADILHQGGNAVDGAIATALCLDVEEAFATTIGSGGGMLCVAIPIRQLRDVI